MKTFIKKITPKFILQLYHMILARIGVIYYHHPSRQMVVIGVTGTKGKSTVVNLISKIFEQAGYKTGIISTVNFKIADKEWANATKQTMPGRFRLQSLLAQMVKADCQYAVIETSSEGIAQYRHLGIDYDAAVFTNLTPEHIESHGSFEKYREAKLKLFQNLYHGYRKNLHGQEIKKLSVVNYDDKSAEYFLLPPADRKITYGLSESKDLLSNEVFIGQIVDSNIYGVTFKVNDQKINLRLLGEFNVYNSLAAMAVARFYGVEHNIIKQALESVDLIPGRMEEIKNNKGFKIYIDYAHEPSSLESVYKTLKTFHPSRIISLLGSQGGGRDKSKRPELGSLAAKYTDYVIVTNEDPYDEDSEQIIDDVINGATQVMGGPPIEKIVDRREAIKKAISIAEKGDIIIITGKGSETVMAVENGQMIPWSDKKEVLDILGK
ncbi:MAG: UDP-N-acetylmuramoyl-L-alanyl-D-glutamate--2,6-diaminopimelate ligase [bacterium]|nr:UDP-N-acetylmuramoyl-L-alanyl-D-glutamate--2,6-diaminopimelate ligase [bacterium]